MIELLKKYAKIFFILSIAIWAFFSGIIIYTKIKTGDWFYKDLTLAGGKSILIEYTGKINVNSIENILRKEFGNVYVREITNIYNQPIAIKIDLPYNANVTKVLEVLQKFIQIKSYSVYEFSPLLTTELRALLYSIILALAFISAVIFLRIRKMLPSITIILSVIYDLTNTLGLFDLLKIPVSLMTIGAFLMIIGYAIDNNIVLATYYFRDKDLKRGLITGWTMWGTTVAALLAVLLFVKQYVVQQLVLALFVAEIFDFIAFTFLNTSIYILFGEKFK